MCIATALFWLKSGYCKKKNFHWLIRNFMTCLVLTFITNQALRPAPSGPFRRLWWEETRPVTLALLFPTPSHTLPRKQYTHLWKQLTGVHQLQYMLNSEHVKWPFPYEFVGEGQIRNRSYFACFLQLLEVIRVMTLFSSPAVTLGKKSPLLMISVNSVIRAAVSFWDDITRLQHPVESWIGDCNHFY